MTGAEFSAFTQISDDDLKQAIREVKLSLPECGQSMVRGIFLIRHEAKRAAKVPSMHNTHAY